MAALTYFLFVYLLGGLTLLPLIFAIIFCHAYLCLPLAGSDELSDEKDIGIDRHVNKSGDSREKQQLLGEGFDARQDIPRTNTLTAGYFTVNREFVPGGISSRPSERISSAGTVIHNESLNVYQSMYRSIFDRGKLQPVAVEGSNTAGKAARKTTRNTFYIVLRCVTIHNSVFSDMEISLIPSI